MTNGLPISPRIYRIKIMKLSWYKSGRFALRAGPLALNDELKYDWSLYKPQLTKRIEPAIRKDHMTL